MRKAAKGVFTMKRYQKTIACILAVTVSAGATGTFAYSKNADALEHSASVTADAAPLTKAASRIAGNDLSLIHI